VSVPDADDRLTALAEAIADGETPDWDSASAEASNDEELVAIRQLRAIAEASRVSAELAVHASMSVRSLLAHGRPSDGPGALETPIIWGSLRVHEKIGRGRFGDVYRAWDPSLDRDVALKLLRHDDGAADRLVVDEGRLMARVRHPNVATIYGAQRIDGRTGLWMELIEGQTLEAELATRGPFSPEEIVRVGIELCRALAAVHRAGLVHRDVKAQNVLQEAGGRIVLGDFGTGHELHEDTDATAMAGTPAYLAPEVFQHAPATPQRDVYSLGALLFHLATGSYPIRGRTVREIREAHARGAPTRLRELRPDLPERLLAAVDTALEPDPARRFPDAGSMEAALGHALPESSSQSARRLFSWSVLGLGAAIVAVAIGLVWVGQARDAGGRRGAVPLPGGFEGARSFRLISPDPTLSGPGGPSPDGRLLSFMDDRGDLAIHEIATGKRWALTGNAIAKKPTGYAETSRFTRDGTQLLYVWYPATAEEAASDSARPTEIRTIPIRGGTPRVLLNDPGNAELVLKHWAGDDRVILVNRWKAEQRSELAVVDLEAATVRAVHPIGSTSPYGASLSPDATLVVYDKPDPATRLRDIYLAAVGHAQETPLIRDASSDHTPMWTPDGRFVLFLSDRSGPTSLWAQRVDGARPVGRPIRVEPNLGWSFPMGETANGAYFFRRQMGTRDVYIADLDSTGAIPGEPVRASSEVVGANGSSDWSPDGKQLTFFRRRDDRWSLVIKSVDERLEREINNPNIVGIGRPRWEAGGTSILFKAAFHERSGLHRVDLKTGAISTMIPHFIGHYDVVPGGRELIYETNRRTFFRHDLVTGVSMPIHKVDPPWAMFGMAVSPDGNRLAYTASLGARGPDPGNVVALRVVELANPSTFREVYRCPPEEYMDAHAWTPDGREVIVKRAKRKPEKGGDGSRVWAVDVETRTARLLGLHVNGINQIRLSPDGRRLSFDGGWPSQEVWVLENFLSSLEGR
jgi:Tol biopolymer transport system component